MRLESIQGGTRRALIKTRDANIRREKNRQKADPRGRVSLNV